MSAQEKNKKRHYGIFSYVKKTLNPFSQLAYQGLI